MSLDRVLLILSLSVLVQACGTLSTQRAVFEVETSHSPTGTIVKVPSLTPLPSLTTNSQIVHLTRTPSFSSVLKSLTSGTDDCSLPCWNDITPGQSEPSTVVPFFDRLGIELDEDEIPDDTRNRGSVFRQPMYDVDGGSLFNILVSWDGDSVDLLGTMFAGAPEFLHPSNVAQSFGQPEIIELAFFRTDSEGVYEYEIRLWYQSIGSRFRYSGLLDLNQREEMCLDRLESLFVTIDIYSRDFGNENFEFIPDEQIASTMANLGLNKQEFFDLLTNVQKCVPIPSDVLPAS